MTPVRLKLSRRKGFDLQELSLATNGLPAINVSRSGEWGNPFRVVKADAEWWVESSTNVWRFPSQPEAIKAAVALFKINAVSDANEKWRQRAKLALQGRNLACWCAASDPCHASVLLELANPFLRTD